jgi:hypothetical protein
VMGVPEWALRPAVERRVAADRTNRRHFQGFALVQRRQQAGQAAGEQGLAGAWRAGEQQVVSICTYSTSSVLGPYNRGRYDSYSRQLREYLPRNARNFISR